MLNKRNIIVYLLIFPTICFSQNNYEKCNDFFKEWHYKKSLLVSQTNCLEKGIILDHESLRQIVYPEYFTYNELINSFEYGFVKFYYQLNNHRFKTISVGPFQMQLKFIKELLDGLLINDIKNAFLIECKTGGYDFLIDNLDKLTSLNIQWELLLLFEKISIKKDYLTNSRDINKLVFLYNSGTIELEKNIKYFSKITCDLKTYLEWTKYFSSF
jgi:hypothetical protein